MGMKVYVELLVIMDLFPSTGEERDLLCWVLLKKQTLSKGPNGSGVTSPHLRMETDPVSKTLCSLVFRIPGDGQSPKTQ
jgi:hypothetical protein